MTLSDRASSQNRDHAVTEEHHAAIRGVSRVPFALQRYGLTSGVVKG